MRVDHVAVQAFLISDAPKLDPILVFIQDFGGSGRIVVECYGRAWSAYFGAIGDRSMHHFLAGCHPSYLSGKLASHDDALIAKRHQKHSEDYRMRVSEAVLDALRLARAAMRSGAMAR